MTQVDFHHPLTRQIADFLRRIGLEVRAGTVPERTALPGITIDRGVLIVEEARLTYPGDLLHEAGHLAVVAPARRATFHHDVGKDGGDEMAAIAWSYAAALHLKIDPALVFHEAGYRGGSGAILTNFAGGHYFGVPILSLAGLAHEPRRASADGVESYPHMIRWLREA